MLRSKRDVDNYVHDVLSKVRSEKERSLRCLSIAQQYFKIGDYESAKRYCETYLSVKDDSSVGHKLLGQCYEHLGEKLKALEKFKFSLQLNMKQPELLLKLCELMSQDDVVIDKEQARYWFEKGEKCFPHHPVIFKLKQRLIRASDSNNTDVIENIIAKEVDENPDRITPWIQLLTLNLDNNKVNAAFEKAFSKHVEKSFFNNIECCECYYSICKVYKDQNKDSIGDEFYIFYMFVLDRLLALSVREIESKSSDRNLPNCLKYLREFDRILFESSSLTKNIKFHGLFQVIIRHMSVQLSFHMANILLKKAKMDDRKWEDVMNYVSSLLLYSLASTFSNYDMDDFYSTNENLSRIFSLCRDSAEYRIFQSGYTVIMLADNSEKLFIEKVLHFSSGMWKENLIEKLFSNTAGYIEFLKSSYFLKCSEFLIPTEIPLNLPNEIKRHCEVSELVHPGSLHHLVWLGVHYLLWDNKSILNSRLPDTFVIFGFNSIQFSTRRSCTSSAESLCILDIEAFLYASIFCAKSVIDEERRQGFYYKDTPYLFPSDICQPLCTIEQKKWWNFAYQMATKFVVDNDISVSRLTLQHGIEVVRLLLNRNMCPQILVQLARTFMSRAKHENRVERAEALESRGLLYWNAALTSLEKSELSGPTVITKQMFTYMRGDLTESEKINLLNEGRMAIATKLMKDKQYESAIDMMKNLHTPQAYFNLGSMYLQMALNEIDKYGGRELNSSLASTAKILLGKARQYLQMCKDSIQFDTSHSLYEPVLAKLEDFEQFKTYLENSRISDESSFLVANDRDWNGSTPIPERYLGKTLTSIHESPLTPRRNNRSSTINTPQSASGLKSLSMDQTQISSMMEQLLKRFEKFEIKVTDKLDFLSTKVESVLSKEECQNSKISELHDMINSVTKQMDDLQCDVFKIREIESNSLSIPDDEEQHYMEQLQAVMPETKSANLLFGQQKYFSGNSSSPPSFSVSQTSFIPPQSSYISQIPPPPPVTIYPTPEILSLTAGGNQAFNIPPNISRPEIIPSETITYGKSPSRPTSQSSAPVTSIPHSMSQISPHNKSPVLLPPNVTITHSEPKVVFGGLTFGSKPVLKQVEEKKPIVAVETKPKENPFANLNFSPVVKETATEKPKTTTDSMFGSAGIPLSQLLKKEVGSWECSDCYTDNKSDRNTCVACTAPKPKTSSWICGECSEDNWNALTECTSCGFLKDVIPPVSNSSDQLKTTESLFDKFKPKAGSWECDQCLVRNDASLNNCSACLSPRISSSNEGTKSVPKSESTPGSFSFGGTSSPFPSFGFGTSTKPFTFGIQNDSKLMTSSSSSFSFAGNTKPELATTSSSPFTFGIKSDLTGTDAKPANIFQPTLQSSPGSNTTPTTIFGETKSFSFTPRRKSERSESGTEDEANESVDNIHFDPIIELPDLVPLVTGEEDEIIMYQHRAKLFRLTDGEWKERGVGDIKILRHKDSGKIRFLMRRLPIEKICLNHYLFAGLELKEKTNRSYYWAAPDYSEGEVVNETFAVMFKTSEIALEFKSAFEQAMNEIENKISTPKKDTESVTVPSSGSGLSDRKIVVESTVDNNKQNVGSDSGTEDEAEESTDNIHFDPIVELPDLVPLVTGEEDETVVYQHRAKLYRMTNGEWKERGVGDIKILRHNVTKKIRFLMRRMPIEKICLNHYLFLGLELKEKTNRSYYWAAPDYSEGELVNETFAIMFKTPEIAQEFKTAFEKAIKELENISVSEKTTISESKNISEKPARSSTSVDDDDDVIVISDVTKEDEKLAASLQLPPQFYAYKYSNKTCSGCPGCDDDKEDSDAPKTNSIAHPKTPGPKSKTAPSSTDTVKTPLKEIDPISSSSTFDTPPSPGDQKLVSSSTGSSGKSTTPTIISTPSTGCSSFTSMFSGKSSFLQKNQNLSIFNVPQTSQNSSPSTGGSVFSFGQGFTSSFDPKTVADSESTPSSSNDGESESSKSAPIPRREIAFKPSSLNFETFSFATPPPKASEPSAVSKTSSSSLFTFGSSSKPATFGSLASGQSVFGSSSIFGSSGSANKKETSGGQPDSTTAASVSFKDPGLSFASLAKDTESKNNDSFPAFSFKDPGLSFGSLANASAGEETKSPPTGIGFKDTGLSFGSLANDSAGEETKSPPTGFSFKDTGLSFGSLANTSAGEVTKSPPTSFSFKETDISFGSLANASVGDQKTSPLPNFGFKDTGPTFGSLASAAASEEKTTPETKATPGESPKSSLKKSSDFSWQGAGTPLFNTSNNASTKAKGTPKSQDDSDEDNEDNENEPDSSHDPHFEPIVPLPPKIEVLTGEEDEDIKFSERGKVYRYSQDTKEWKERGVGYIKILFNPKTETYRLLMRREVVHKLVLNQRLVSSFEIQSMSISLNSWCWTAMNWPEECSEPSLEQLAVRFKNEVIANQFHQSVMKSVDHLKRIQEKSPKIPSIVKNKIEEVDENQYSENSDKSGYSDYDHLEDSEDLVNKSYADEQAIKDAMEDYENSCDDDEILFSCQSMINIVINGQPTSDEGVLNLIANSDSSSEEKGKVIFYDMDGAIISVAPFTKESVMQLTENCCMWSPQFDYALADGSKDIVYEFYDHETANIFMDKFTEIKNSDEQHVPQNTSSLSS